MKEPPHNHEAEEAVLGSMLLEPGCIPDVVRKISGGDFHHPANEELFGVIVEMNAQRLPADIVTLTDRLRDTGRLAALGGPACIAALLDTPTAANAGYYAQIVREKSQLRQVWKLTRELHLSASQPNASVQDMAAQLSSLLSGLASGQSEYKTIGEHMDDALDRYEKAWQNQGQLPKGVIPTGLTELDEALDCGLYPADFAVLAAETSGGKTALAMNAIGHAALARKAGCAVFSYEMKATQLVDRLVALQAKIAVNRLRQGAYTETEFHRLSNAVSTLRATNVHLRDRIGKWAVDDVANESRAIMAKYGLGFIVVDYLQLMAPRPASRNKQHNREREVAEMSRALKDLAIELDVPVLALSQLNDEGKLRESRGLGHDADVVLTIENAYDATDKKRLNPLDDQRNIRINKNRSGKRDQTIRVGWTGPLMAFSDL